MIILKPAVRATVLTDASYCPFTRCGGWAAWVNGDHMQAAAKHSGRIHAVGMPSSTDAEVYAALNGVWLARHYGATHILLRTDCKAVLYLADGTAKSERLISVWSQAISREDMSGIYLRVTHIRAHGEIKCRASYVNDWCDRRAKAAMRQFRKELQSGYDSI